MSAPDPLSPRFETLKSLGVIAAVIAGFFLVGKFVMPRSGCST